MNDSQSRWEKRHREASSQPAPDTTSFLLESFPLLPAPGPHSRALDLACGAGHNAVWLAERGRPVVAVDYAPAALARAAAHAATRGVRSVGTAVRRPLSIPRNLEGLLLVEADLEALALPAASFDLILCFQYLDRAFFPHIERALAPGGHLLYESFTAAQREFPEGPRSPEHLLASGELRAAFPSLTSLFYREYVTTRAMASLIARRPL